MALENKLWKVKQMLLRCHTKAGSTVLAEGPPLSHGIGPPEG